MKFMFGSHSRKGYTMVELIMGIVISAIAATIIAGIFISADVQVKRNNDIIYFKNEMMIVHSRIDKFVFENENIFVNDDITGHIRIVNGKNKAVMGVLLKDKSLYIDGSLVATNINNISVTNGVHDGIVYISVDSEYGNEVMSFYKGK